MWFSGSRPRGLQTTGYRPALAEIQYLNTQMGLIATVDFISDDFDQTTAADLI